MPQLIKRIDEIAIEKQRDVLYVRFTKEPFVSDDEPYERFREWRNCAARQAFLQWRQDNNIAAIPCGPPSIVNGWIIEGYFGDLYLDVPFKTDNADFQKLSAHLEFPDGNMKQPHICFCYFPLEVAERYKREYPSGVSIT